MVDTITKARPVPNGDLNYWVRAERLEVSVHI